MAACDELEWLAVLDFEATCLKDQRIRPQEIIELPTVLLHVRTRARVEFQRYVRPTHHPRLSAFCTELTGIEQHTVDAADEFLPAFREHRRWLAQQTGGARFLFVTCGDWDLKTALPAQLAALGERALPREYARWCNVKRAFEALRGGKARGMMDMIDRTPGLAHTGRHHSGIDDCRNIAGVCEGLLDAGAARGWGAARVFAPSPAAPAPPARGASWSWSGALLPGGGGGAAGGAGGGG
eukprot:g8276.t1